MDGAVRRPDGSYIGQPGRGTTLQGSANRVQTTQKTPQRTASVASFQPAYNPQQAYAAPATSSYAASTLAAPAPSGFVAPNGKVYSSQEAYQAEVQAQKVAALRDSLTGVVDGIQNVYQAIYGDINTTASDKNKGILQTYNEDVNNLTDQFTEEFPAIGRAFSARNTYDSSYRVDKEDNAKAGFGRTLQTRGRARNQDISELGRWVATQKANIDAEKGLTRQTYKQLLESDNEDELQAGINSMQARMAQLKASRAGLRSQASYMDTVNKTVPGGSRLAELRPVLTNVIKSQVPSSLKQQIAANLVANAGLSPEEAQAALADFNIQLSDEEQLPIAGA